MSTFGEAGRKIARRALRRPWLSALDPLLREAALVAASLRGPSASRAATDALYRRGNHTRPLLLGHRGAMARAPENTLGAFRAALDDGGDGVELDVQLTADAVPIVLHDDLLDRTTDKRGKPLRYTADELDDADAGSWFANGTWRDREKIPRLDEVFSGLAEESVINVELKGPTPAALGLERRVLSVMRAFPKQRVIVSSFHPAQLLTLRRLAPDVPVGLLFDGQSLLPLRTAWAAPVLAPDAIHPHSSLVDGTLVASAHAAGMRVHVWGVSGRTDSERLLELGVDALIVDDVAETAELFRARGWVQ